MNQPLDILAIAAHRDDVEQKCGGTLLKAAERGQTTGILDLTQGEMGTRGTAEDRANEASDAAKILGTTWRRALDIPDGRVENTWENRLKVASVLRETRPRVVILPYWKGRHPDHYTASVLGYEACFLAGLKKLELGGQDSAVKRSSFGTNPIEQLAPHRPFKIIYATLYYDVRPSFVVDISDQEAGKDLFPAHDEIRARVDAMARFYGMLGGVTHAEPFLQKEVGLVEDLLSIPVKSIFALSYDTCRVSNVVLPPVKLPVIGNFDWPIR